MKSHFKLCLSRLFICGMVLFVYAGRVQGATTKSLNQYGITWTWLEEREYGTFANGDYWVVGPITLTGITGTNDDGTVRGSISGITTPDTSNVTINGSMINPISGNYTTGGFDSRLSYSESLNMARKNGAPLSGSNTRTVAAGSSICSTSSRILVGTGAHALLNDFAILTVVSSPPADGSFRPPYIGADKTLSYNKSALNYSILKNLAPVTGMNSPTSSGLARPWMMVEMEYNNSRDYAPYKNQPEYDRDMGFAIQTAMLELHQNYSNATKELAYVRLVQYGIDVYGALKYGSNGPDSVRGEIYHPYFGNTCQKGPLVLAALALNDTDMKFYCNADNKIYLPPMWYNPNPVTRVGPDGGSGYVTQAIVDGIINDGYLSLGPDRQRLKFTSQMIGLPEFLLENGQTAPQSSGSNWGVDYRNVRYSGLVGQILAVQLITGAKALWNYDAIFDYTDRAAATYKNSASGDPTVQSVRLFWDAYRAQGNPIWTQAAPVSGIGWVSKGGNTITIEYTDNVNRGSESGAGLAITASGGPVTASYFRGKGITQLVFRLSRTILLGETLSYTYTQSGTGVKAHTGGANVATVTNIPIVNYSQITGATTPSGATTSIRALDQ